MDNLALMFNNMGASEIISIGLGVLSLVLGVISIVITFHYRNLDKKIDRVAKRLQLIEGKKINEIYVACRDIHRKVNNSSGIILSKDTLCVFITDKYKKKNKKRILEKIHNICPDILKKTYIEYLINELNSDDSIGRSIDLTLRYEYNKNDLKQIEGINKEFESLGLHFEYTAS